MTMDNALIHTRCEQTVQHLLDKIDKVCDEARDNGGPKRNSGNNDKTISNCE